VERSNAQVVLLALPRRPGGSRLGLGCVGVCASGCAGNSDLFSRKCYTRAFQSVNASTG
jgi:hypothetical protein